jgi:hypothetical protein
LLVNENFEAKKFLSALRNRFFRSPQRDKKRWRREATDCLLR